MPGANCLGNFISVTLQTKNCPGRAETHAGPAVDAGTASARQRWEEGW